MADLHEALKALAPTDYADVPQDDLPAYLTNCFRNGELICNSVPPPPNGTPFAASHPSQHKPDAARSHNDMVASDVRPFPPDQEHEELQKTWGKAMKYSHKENPLNVAVYKTAGHDRHGAWFARRSVHEGLGFNKFKKAMQREFPEALTVQGGPGAGNVRGIGADRRLERVEAPGVGRMEVYELSSSFPGPTTPRDFLTLFLTSDDALTEKSAAELTAGKKHIPRHFMVVSKPVKHPDAPPKSGLIRGQYESVEMIREIPLHAAKHVSQSTPNLLHDSDLSEEAKTRHRGATVSSDPADHDGDVHGGGGMDPELNPVEWIMITRSDPGGGIPRFLVERGTPGQMLIDVHKWLDWACGKDEIPDADADMPQQEATNEKTTIEKHGSTHLPNGDKHHSHPAITTAHKSLTDRTHPHDHPAASGGIISNLTNAIEAGIDAYAPAAVSNYVHTYTGHNDQTPPSDSSSDTSSMNSFLSAEEERRVSTAHTHPAESKETLDSVHSAASPTLSTDPKKNADGKHLNRHEKEVLKLAQQREKLNEKLEQKRKAEEEKLNHSKEKEVSEQEKAKEKYDAQMKKQEEKHQREIEKLERKKEKEGRKAEERRRKQNDRDSTSRVTRERDDFRDQVDLLRRENDALRSHVAELQKENTAMATKLGKLGPAGNDALRSVRDEIAGRSRSSSLKSVERKAISRDTSPHREKLAGETKSVKSM